METTLIDFQSSRPQNEEQLNEEKEERFQTTSHSKLHSSAMATPSPSSSSSSVVHKIRLTILCARSLAKRDLFRLPDPYVRVTVDPVRQDRSVGATSCAGQTHCTETARNTLDPKWNSHYDLLLRPTDAVTISVWNEKKAQRANVTPQSKKAAGFLGCVRLLSNAVERLKDTGYQRLDLVSDNHNPLPVKGQIIVSLLSRDGQGTGINE